MMLVRLLTLGDLAAYRALHRFALTESPTSFAETVAEYDARGEDQAASALARGEAWGVFEADRLVGKLTIDAPPYSAFGHTRWVHAVYLHPDARGSGAGAALMRAALAHAEAQGAWRILLWVHTENAAARGFYERLGFQEVGRIPQGFAVGDGYVDDVLMCLSLEPPRLDATPNRS